MCWTAYQAFILFSTSVNATGSNNANRGGNLHERVVDRDDKDLTSIPQLGVVDPARDVLRRAGSGESAGDTHDVAIRGLELLCQINLVSRRVLDQDVDVGDGIATLSQDSRGVRKGPALNDRAGQLRQAAERSSESHGRGWKLVFWFRGVGLQVNGSRSGGGRLQWLGENRALAVSRLLHPASLLVPGHRSVHSDELSSSATVDVNSVPGVALLAYPAAFAPCWGQLHTGTFSTN